MKFINTILPLAALTSAFVIPDEEMTTQILSSPKSQPQSFLDRIQGNIDNVWSEVEETFKDAVVNTGNSIDNAINRISESAKAFECHESMTKFDAQGWLDSTIENVEDMDMDIEVDHPHHPPPHHRKPKHPHHGHKHSPNKTVYELIASSKYTTKLAKLINEYPDLVSALNGTAANYTVFAPTDAAFEKLPKHHKKPSKEVIKKILGYHVSADFYPAGRVLVTHTIPTILGEPELGGEAQRLRVGLSLSKALNVNFYSRIIAINILGTNGVIHAIDSLLLPPPSVVKIISLLPGEFSTLELALIKSGLTSEPDDVATTGGTLFAPTNWAFKKLGPKINAFLFSSHGEKYLKALLKYHVVVNQTLYSDAFYKSESVPFNEERVDTDGELDTTTEIPKGRFHIDLPTLLKDKSLSIDIARYGGWIQMKINGYTDVKIQDGIAQDGVIHVLDSVLIPPKAPGGFVEGENEGEGMSTEELKRRLENFDEGLREDL